MGASGRQLDRLEAGGPSNTNDGHGRDMTGTGLTDTRTECFIKGEAMGHVVR